MKPFLALAALTVGVMASVLLAGCRPVTPPAQTARMTTANPEDTVTIERTEGVTVIDVSSPRGIGAAQVTLSPALANEPLQVRFHLHGLEQATFDNRAAQLTVSIASHPPYPASQTLTTGGMTRVLDADDAFWAAVELAPNDAATPVIPLTSGAFVITLPAAFVDGDHPDLSLSWIDFFR